MMFSSRVTMGFSISLVLAFCLVNVGVITADPSVGLMQRDGAEMERLGGVKVGREEMVEDFANDAMDGVDAMELNGNDRITQRFDEYGNVDTSDVDSAVTGVLVGYFIVLGICCICNIVIPFCLYNQLVAMDQKLPPQNRYMTQDMSLIYWIVCFFTSCVVSIIMYVLFKQEIERRMAMVNSGQGFIPVQTGMAYAQPGQQLYDQYGQPVQTVAAVPTQQYDQYGVPIPPEHKK